MGRNSRGWDAGVCEDHQALEAQAGALEAALTVDVGAQDRRVVLSWIVRTLWPALELHLRKERDALFPRLASLLGKNAAALTLLERDHQELRAGLRHLAELVQDPDALDWQKIPFAAESFINLLEEHERLEDRLLLDVLRHSLKSNELKLLSQAFRQVAEKAHAEEGWPIPWWK